MKKIKKWIILIGIIALFYSPIITYAQGTDLSCEVSKEVDSGVEETSTNEEGGFLEVVKTVGLALLVVTLLGGIMLVQIDHIKNNIG